MSLDAMIEPTITQPTSCVGDEMLKERACKILAAIEQCTSDAIYLKATADALFNALSVCDEDDILYGDIPPLEKGASFRDKLASRFIKLLRQYQSLAEDTIQLHREIMEASAECDIGFAEFSEALKKLSGILGETESALETIGCLGTEISEGT